MRGYVYVCHVAVYDTQGVRIDQRLGQFGKLRWNKSDGSHRMEREQVSARF
jgi:hypothetical protein